MGKWNTDAPLTFLTSEVYTADISLYGGGDVFDIVVKHLKLSTCVGKFAQICCPDSS